MATAPKPKKKLPKRPTGELPKRNSSLAKFITGTKSNKLNAAEGRTAAGKYRDAEKKMTGPKNFDTTGRVLRKSIEATQKPAKNKKK
jgi:hypothetical protein